tara:strand:- start:613 stop:1278 length:666 start_codon:yes stop_codon:yes gene_type:complete
MSKRIGKYKVGKHDVLGGELNRGVSVGTVIGETGDFAGAVTSTGVLSGNASQNWLGVKKYQSFVGSLADTDGATTTYTTNDIAVELGELDTTVPSGHVAATQIFVDKVLVGITTTAGDTCAANMVLSDTTGTATNATTPTNSTEIVGAGVASFDTRVSAAGADVTEIDIDMHGGNGHAHVFAPNVNVAVARKYLYLRFHTAIDNATVQAGRFTVLVEYTLY